MFSLGSTNVDALKAKTLDWAVKSGDVKLQDIFYPIGSVACSISGTELSWNYYQEVSLYSTTSLNLLHILNIYWTL